MQNFLVSEFKNKNQEKKKKSPVGFCHLRLGFLSQILSSLESLRYVLASLREHFFCFVLCWFLVSAKAFFFFSPLFNSSSHSPEQLIFQQSSVEFSCRISELLTLPL